MEFKLKKNKLLKLEIGYGTKMSQLMSEITIISDPLE